MNDWILDNKQLHRTFTFSTFQDAFAFMTKVAEIAEELQHHPTWSNTYNIVDIFLSTHEVGDVSEKDYELAERINVLFALR
jgi:4a-hydroxytetrahydrobiopterin dehydratase